MRVCMAFNYRGSIVALRSSGASLAAVAAALLLAACTASHDLKGLGQQLDSGQAGKAGGGAGKAGSSASAGSAGGSAGARAGSGGSGGRGGSGAAGRAGTSAAGSGGAACGPTCTAPAILGFFPLTACCAPGNRCGVDLTAFGSGCVEQNAPGNLDSSCPADDLSQPGCCRPVGVCGIVDSFANLGCIDSGTGVTTRCTPK